MLAREKRPSRPAALAAVLLLSAFSSGLLLWFFPPGTTPIASPAPSVSAPSSAHIQAFGAETPHYQRGQGAGTVLQSKGDGASQRLRYVSYDEPADAPAQAQIRITQSVQTKRGGKENKVVTQMIALVNFETGGEDSFTFISFQDFDVRVEADGETLEIDAVSRLLEGLKVKTEVDPMKGLVGEEVVAANPQVKRLILMLLDSLRQLHPTLPEEEVGVGAKWEQKFNWSAPSGSLTSEQSSAHQLKSLSKNALLSTSRLLSISGKVPLEDGDKVDISGAGKGQISILLNEGKLDFGRGEFIQEQKFGSGAQESLQKIKLQFEFQRCKSESSPDERSHIQEIPFQGSTDFLDRKLCP